MTRRIFFKIILTFIALLALGAWGAEKFASSYTKELVITDTTNGLRDKARMARAVLGSVPEADAAALSQRQRFAESVHDLADAAGTRVTVIRADGTVVADTQAEPSAMELHHKRPEFEKALQGGEGTDIRTSATVNTALLYLAIPMDGGAIRFARELSAIDKEIRAARFQIWTAFTLTFVVVTLLAAWLARRFSARLSELIEYSQTLSKGYFRAPAPRTSGGELGELARALSRTSGKLRSNFEILDQERMRFAAIVECLSEGILVTNRKLQILLFNPAMREMYPHVRLAEGGSIEDWPQPELVDLFRDVFETGRPDSINIELSRPAERSFRVSVIPVTHSSGSVESAVASFYDVTEMELVNRMRRDFVANVSHELRTPLAAIQGYAETLLDGAIADERHNERFLRIIQQNSIRLTQITSDLMDLSQIESNANQLIYAPHSIRDLLRRAADAVRPAMVRQNHELVLEPILDSYEIETDSRSIQQILINLLDNAAKYTPDGGVVTLGAKLDGNSAEFSVTDTGIGIASDDLPRLFERFYRVDKARSRAAGGTGLGLAIVKHLVLSLRGSVDIESEPGAGSTFRVRVPIAEHAKPIEPPQRQKVLF